MASEHLEDEPVIALQGPRTVGKSTLLGELASSRGVEVVDLDEPATRAAVLADPGAFVDGPSPVCIDEYQHVPAVLDAIKAQLNRELRPGRYVITGSTRYDALPIAAQSLTGRLHLLTVWPLTQGEIDGVRENLLAALLDDPVGAPPRGTFSQTSKVHYIARITAGGMPIPLARRSPAARNRWFDDYVELVLERDVRELSRLRQREQLPALLRRLAAQTAGVLNVTRAAGEAGLERTTAADYVKLLEAVFLIMRLPAWGTTVRARATSAPKVHVVDAGLAARLLGLTAEKLARRDASSLSQFGHLLETFVVGELIRQASWQRGDRNLGTLAHLRRRRDRPGARTRRRWHARLRGQGRGPGCGPRHAPSAQAARRSRRTLPDRRGAVHRRPCVQLRRPPPRNADRSDLDAHYRSTRKTPAGRPVAPLNPPSSPPTPGFSTPSLSIGPP